MIFSTQDHGFYAMLTPFTRSETWEDGFILDEVILTIWGYRCRYEIRQMPLFLLLR